MPSLMTTTDLEIAYGAVPSGFDYHIHLCGSWVASATTNHIADMVADEVRYRTFLGTDPDPIPPGPGEEGDIDGVPQG